VERLNNTSRWRETGKWWSGERPIEVLRYRDAKGVLREKQSEMPPIFAPNSIELPAPQVEDHREDWSLRANKLRDEKAAIAVYGKPEPLILTKGTTSVPYVPLHVHSGYSFGRGVMLTDELVQFAANMGLPAVAITDSFSLAGAYEVAKHAKSAGIKPIIGSTFTLENGGEIVLLAKSKLGFQNLSKLISDCHLLEPRQFPLLKWEYLTCTEGLLCLTGGNSGPLLPLLLRKDFAGAKERLNRLVGVFGAHSVFVEIERSFLPFERQHNDLLTELAAELNLKTVAGGMVTHARPSHFPVQDVITCAHHLCQIDEIWGRKPFRDDAQPQRFHLPERGLNAERYLHTPLEMQTLFQDAPELLLTTLEIADQIDEHVLPARTVLPKLYDYPEQVLNEVTWRGAMEKYPVIAPKLRRRIEHELERINRLGYAGHFLTSWDMCAWATERGISFSGRGSVVDSVVSYCLNFSRIDAFRHNLHFDRFLPEDGSKRPDIDLDFPATHRDAVRSYLTGKYGKDHVATVAAFGAYCTRGIIRQVGKVFGLPNETISYIAKHLHRGVRAQHVEMSLQNRPELRNSNIPKETLQWVFALAGRMADIPKSIGAHSSGVIISSRPIWETVPVMHSASEHEGENLRIIQWDKRSAKHYFDKFDILCLRGQDVLQGTETRLRQKDSGFNVSDVPVEEEAGFATMRSGHLIGIPQSASPAMRQAHIRLGTRNLDDASLVQAGIRPGVGGAVKLNELIARRAGKPYEFSHPELEEILGHTYGIIVFQEQVDLLLQVFAGYSSGEAEDTRELIHKRRREDFGAKIKEDVMRRILAKGYPVNVADEVFELIAGFKGYGFAQGHALAFSEISLRSVHLQQNFPAPYFAALLDAQPAGYYGPCTLAVEARSRGVVFLPPCVNASESGFSVVDVKSTVDPKIVFPNGGIRVALRQIHGLSRALVNRIAIEQPFRSVFDFALRAQPNRDELETLTLCGALDNLHQNRREILWSIPRIQQYVNAQSTPGTLPLDCPDPVMHDGVDDFNVAEKLVHERRILGMDVSTHLMCIERERVASRGGLTVAEVNGLGHGRTVIAVGNPIRLRFPPTPSGKRVVFFDLEDETGILNVTCFDAVYQRDGHSMVCAPYVTVIGKTQIRDGHLAFLAKRVFPYRPHILTLLDAQEAAPTGKADMGWGAASLPIVTADFLVG
jgi:error-prone DNA polymerase